MESLPDLATLSDDDLKTLIDELTEEENEVSFRRRLLQGRIDILRAERTARLKGKGVSDVDVEALTDILSSRSAPQRPDLPAWPAPMFVRSSKVASLVRVARSLATHFAGSQ